MERVYGIETEYGLAARTGSGRLSPSEAAGWLFRPIERKHRSSNAFLPNGGRLYLDVGAHPEYATPECRRLTDLLVAERAGDEIIAQLAAAAATESSAEGTDISFRLFKNNVDSFGNSYGSHENYLVGRELELSVAADALTAFLVTRQILCGAGRWHRGEFLISQRADHLHDQLSATTTRARPLINTRDEPLADPSRFRRLHVLAGDSNLSEPSSLLKIGTTELVLRAVESDQVTDGHRFAALRLSDPAEALRRTARNPLARLAMADGSTATAVEIQRRYLDAVEHDPALAEVAAAWVRVLDALESGDWDTLAADVEWAAKRRLLADYRDRHRLSPQDPRLDQLDLAFHQLGGQEGRPSGLFRLLEARGAVNRITTPEAVQHALTEPPSDTRAAARSRFLRAAQRWSRDFTADWMTFTVHDLPDAAGRPSPVRVSCPDPFEASVCEVDELVDLMATRPRVRPTGSFTPPPV